MYQLDLGSKISTCRQNKNMTQEELANRLGVTPQALSKWERNQSLPDVTLIAALCNVLEVSADSLLNTGAQKITENADRETEEEILRKLRNCLQPLELIFAESLVPAFLDNKMEDIVAVRKRLAGEGILMPLVRVRDEGSLKENEFMILSYRNVLHEEVVNGSMEENYRDIIACMEKTVREQYAALLSKDIIKRLVDNLAVSYPALVGDTVPEKISYGLLLDILKNLWSAEIPFVICRR